MKTMNERERKRYFRLIYRRTFDNLGGALVISLLAGMLLGGGFYLVSAVCAAGFVMICWAWFTYLKATGMQPFGRSRAQKKAKIPYVHRRFKEQKPHRPSFEMDSSDFDDDLTSASVVSEDGFSKKQLGMALAIARCICGALMILFSFFIPMQ